MNHFVCYVQSDLDQTESDIEFEPVPENEKDFITHRIGRDVGTGNILLFVTENVGGSFAEYHELDTPEIEAEPENINEASLYRELFPALPLEELFANLTEVGNQIFSA